ncbi:MAG: zf-HC2 domain-containing protein [Lachnospiraceae bacterium]|nr:zf-HC2 domain-containing protein [Lachnospiraceae bacterium]
MELNCKEAQALMQPYVERNISDREMKALIRHVRGCKNCRLDLETNYLAENAGRILMEAGDEVDPAKLLEEDMVHMEWAMNRRLVMTVVLWVMIIILAAIIAAVVAILVSPETFRSLGEGIIEFFNIELDFDFWRMQ